VHPRRFVFREGRTKGIGVIIAAQGSAPPGTWDTPVAQGAPATGAVTPAAGGPAGGCGAAAAAAVAAAAAASAGAAGARTGAGHRVSAP
jgi:hypothetical protein